MRSTSRGERIDIGGRAIRCVRAGLPGAGLLVVCEHGAFGCAADWAVVQEKLAARGLRSLAYDRAGLGHSEPPPAPRHGGEAVADLKALLDALGETGPFLLVGHSMGGLTVRLFALSWPELTAGLVLVDAVTPDVLDLPGAPAAIRTFGRVLQVAGAVGRVGLMRPVSWITGNLIGLSGEAAREKRRIHGSSRHARWAAHEVLHWPTTSELAAAALPAELPVAVVTADGPRKAARLKALQEAPAALSRRGHVEHVWGSTHANLLGPRHADAIVRGVQHVLGS